MTKTARTLSLALIFCTGSLIARAQLPDSPTGRRGNTLIAAIKGGEESITPEFFEQHFAEDYLARRSAEESAAWLRSLVAELGSIGLEGANKTGPFSVTLMGSASATGQQVKIFYDIEDREPHRITRLDFELADAIEPLEQDELNAAADEYLSQLAETGEFSGVALIARQDQVLFEKAYGLANRRFEVPNEADTAFNLGSINKIFTKVALAQLAAAGKLSFDDTVARHLPDYPNPEVAEKITIQQVATHTAGLGDIFTEEFSETSKRSLRGPRDYFRFFAGEPLLFEPGTGEQYSNGGYMVLGAIIAAASGQSYHDYVRQHIFDAAGMSTTRPYSLDDPTAKIATGYTQFGEAHDEVPVHENTFHIPHSGTPAGGGYSTARDLLAFRDAFVDKRLADGRHMAWVITNELPEEEPESMRGIGLGVAGGGPGVNATLEMEGEWTIVVLTNLDPPAASDASAGLRQLVKAVRGSDN